MNNCKKLLNAVVAVMFMAGIYSNVSGQNITNNPANHNIMFDKTLYEHGYNKDNTSSADVPREDRDTVMVNSVMNYFVMPDTYYNKDYFQQNDYKQTSSTKSKFEWTVAAGNTAAPQNANPTGTSPWIKITWGTTTGATDITVKEIPQTIVCDGEEATIPVYVIAKPTIGFNQTGTPAGYTASGCYNDATKVGSYNASLTVTSGSSQVLVDYTVEKTDLYTGVTTVVATVTDAPLAVGTNSPLTVNFTDYGDYKITVTKITDRIARKCDMLGDINAGQDIFTYSVLPQPKAGKTYHIPNNF